jgi:hypothetical protein
VRTWRHEQIPRRGHRGQSDHQAGDLDEADHGADHEATAPTAGSFGTLAGLAQKPGVVLLYPGAGAGRDQTTLVKIDAAVTALRGWSAVRADFPYRTAGRRAPDRPPVLMNAVREELAAIGSRKRVVVGGRSMGGRICSMVAAGADRLAPPKQVVGVVTIAYPLHPPGKPENLRVEHMPDVTVPWLFVCGTRDPFGTPEELTRWTKTIAGPVTHHWVENKGHDLKGADAEVSRVITDWLEALGS